MKKIIAMLVLCSSFVLAINLQTATKEELMNIKGIGEKKAEQILEYRKINSIKSLEDLRNIKGFGDSIINNIRNDVKVKNKLDKQTKGSKNKDTKKENKQDKIKKDDKAKK